MRNSDVTVLLERWTAHGLISADQADRLRADLPRPASPRPLLVEALAYLGAALAVIGLGLLSGRYWTGLGVGGRLALVGGAAALLVTAGMGVPRRAGGGAGRMRAILWLAGVIASAFFALLIGDDLLGWPDTGTLILAATVGVLVAAALWARRPHPVQHIATWLSCLFLAGALTAALPHPDVLTWAAIGATSLAWGVLAWGTLLPPAGLGRLLGATGATVAAVALTEAGWGGVPAAIVIAALVAAGVLLGDLPVLGVSVGGTLLVVPAIVGRYFPGTTAAALALLVIGGALTGVAVMLARRRRLGAPAGDDSRRNGRPGPAAAAATVLLAGAAAAIVAAGI